MPKAKKAAAAKRSNPAKGEQVFLDYLCLTSGTYEVEDFITKTYAEFAVKATDPIKPKAVYLIPVNELSHSLDGKNQLKNITVYAIPNKTVQDLLIECPLDGSLRKTRIQGKRGYVFNRSAIERNTQGSHWQVILGDKLKQRFGKSLSK
jgi:hypothetical protein